MKTDTNRDWRARKKKLIAYRCNAFDFFARPWYPETMRVFLLATQQEFTLSLHQPYAWEDSLRWAWGDENA